MNTYEVASGVDCEYVDTTVVRLRKRGFKAYSEASECGKQFYVVTDATRSAVLLESGAGWFLRSTLNEIERHIDKAVR